jgi:hypothetical protein
MDVTGRKRRKINPPRSILQAVFWLGVLPFLGFQSLTRLQVVCKFFAYDFKSSIIKMPELGVSKAVYDLTQEKVQLLFDSLIHQCCLVAIPPFQGYLLKVHNLYNNLLEYLVIVPEDQSNWNALQHFLTVQSLKGLLFSGEFGEGKRLEVWGMRYKKTIRAILAPLSLYHDWNYVFRCAPIVTMNRNGTLLKMKHLKLGRNAHDFDANWNKL